MVRFSNLSSPEYIMDLKGVGGVRQGHRGQRKKEGEKQQGGVRSLPGPRSPSTHRRTDRLRAPMSWQPCWIPAMR